MKAVEIQISDMHIGHKTAIMYPKAESHKPNRAQKWLFKVFSRNFLVQIDKILDEHKPDYIHLSLLGDMGDLDHHGRAPEEFWTISRGEILENQVNLLRPLVQLADSMHAVRGTKAHIGQSGGIDEALAREYGDQYDPETEAKIMDGILKDDEGVHAGWYHEFELAGVHFEIAHHGKNRSKWTTVNGLTSLGAEILLSRTKTGDRVPDVVSRGHFHYGLDTSINTKPYVVSVASWQLPNNFVYRIDSTVATPFVGGHVIVVEDGRIISGTPLLYKYPRKKAVKLC